MKQLISRYYRNQLIELHENDRYWGSTGGEYFLDVMKAVQEDHCSSVLDYGCGKGYLVALIRDAMASEPKRTPDFLVRCDGYDPAIKEYADLPIPADMVVSTDVLEHIEPENLETVLEHICANMLISGFFVIATRPAKAVLPDERNAHLIQEPESFWIQKLQKFWPIVEAKMDSSERVWARVWK